MRFAKAAEIPWWHLRPRDTVEFPSEKAELLIGNTTVVGKQNLRAEDFPSQGSETHSRSRVEF